MPKTTIIVSNIINELMTKILNGEVDYNILNQKIEEIHQVSENLNPEEYLYYHGQLDLIRKYYPKLITRDEEKYKSIIWSKSRFFKPILSTLYECGALSHQELADILGIKKNYLSNIIKKMEPYYLLEAESFGSKKIYRLTKNGIQLMKRECETDYTQIF